MKTFSVLTVSKRDGWQEMAKANIDKQTRKPNKWVVIQEGINAPTKTKPSNLNASLNAGLRQIMSDYVIFYQDFIELPVDCFDKLLRLVSDNTFVTTCTINPDGRIDGRHQGFGLARKCEPGEWETNVAIAPMSVLRELGGFNEELDWGWSWDNVDVALRAEMLGCKFMIDESNNPVLLEHETTDSKKLELNGDRCAKNIDAIRSGERPLRYNYLS